LQFDEELAIQRAPRTLYTASFRLFEDRLNKRCRSKLELTVPRGAGQRRLHHPAIELSIATRRITQSSARHNLFSDCAEFPDDQALMTPDIPAGLPSELLAAALTCLRMSKLLIAATPTRRRVWNFFPRLD